MPKNPEKSGFLLIDKPKKITSHDAIDFLRKITGVKKIGHSGTLDPFATGLLIIGVGREATKQLNRFLKMDKEYRAKLLLGEVSDTYDIDGNVKKVFVGNPPSLKDVQQTLGRFEGEISQTPPPFSAKKINGKKSYELARKGKKAVLPSQKVRVYKIDLIDYSWPYLEIEVKVSSGTYIRSLANDIGRELKCGALAAELRRLKIGPYGADAAHALKEIQKNNWQSFLLETL